MERTILNSCICGNRFPNAFSPGWEKVERQGRIFARCRCGRVTEAFYHGSHRYWIWPVESERPELLAVR